jgi:galactan 5-O-arabinofuranosyltransferase
VVACGCVSAFLVHALVVALNLDVTNPLDVAAGVGPLWAAAMIALALAGYLFQRRLAPVKTRYVVAVLAGAAVGLVMFPLMAGLHGTAQPPNGVLGGDQRFRIEYVTRFASTWHLDDYTFRGLHSFYPPAWFWVAGRTADVLGVHPAWRVVGGFTIATIGGAMLLAFLLWRMALSPAGALAAATGSLLVLSPQTGEVVLPIERATQAWYSPYACFVAIVGVAWVAAAARVTRMPRERWRIVLLVIVGTALALTYYLLFILLAVVLVVQAFFPWAARRVPLRRVAAILLAIGLITALFWIPLLTAAIGGSASQGHYFRPDFLRVEVGFSGPVALAVLAAASILLLAFTRAWSASRAVGAVLLGAVLYQLLSVATLVFLHDQLQPHRAVVLLWASYGAAIPVALEGLREGAGMSLPRLRPPIAFGAATAIVALAVGTMFALGSAQASDLVGGPLTQAAHKPVRFGWVKYLSDFITSTTGKKPHQLQVVSDSEALLVTRPYWGFLPLGARYAHPAAKLDQRIKALQAAAACPDAACTSRKLAKTPFGPVDALVVSRAAGDYLIHTEKDSFPRPEPVAILFPRKNFDPSVWATRHFAKFTALVRRPGR